MPRPPELDDEFPDPLGDVFFDCHDVALFEGVMGSDELAHEVLVQPDADDGDVRFDDQCALAADVVSSQLKAVLRFLSFLVITMPALVDTPRSALLWSTVCLSLYAVSCWRFRTVSYSGAIATTTLGCGTSRLIFYCKLHM